MATFTQPIWRGRYTVAGTGPFTQTVPLGGAISSQRLLVVALHGWVGANPPTLTTTPNSGSPLDADLIFAYRRTDAAWLSIQDDDSITTPITYYKVLVPGAATSVDFGWVAGTLTSGQYGNTISVIEAVADEAEFSAYRTVHKTDSVIYAYDAAMSSTGRTLLANTLENGWFVGSICSTRKGTVTSATQSLTIHDTVTDFPTAGGAGGVYTFSAHTVPRGLHEITFTPTGGSADFYMIVLAWKAKPLASAGKLFTMVSTPDRAKRTRTRYKAGEKRVRWRDHAIQGTYSGFTPTAIEARVIKQDTSAVQIDWFDTGATIAGGNWSAVIPQIPVGGPWKVEARPTNEPSLIWSENNLFGWDVGTLILMIGSVGPDDNVMFSPIDESARPRIAHLETQTHASRQDWWNWEPTPKPRADFVRWEPHGTLYVNRFGPSYSPYWYGMLGNMANIVNEQTGLPVGTGYWGYDGTRLGDLVTEYYYGTDGEVKLYEEPGYGADSIDRTIQLMGGDLDHVILCPPEPGIGVSPVNDPAPREVIENTLVQLHELLCSSCGITNEADLPLLLQSKFALRPKFWTSYPHTERSHVDEQTEYDRVAAKYPWFIMSHGVAGEQDEEGWDTIDGPSYPSYSNEAWRRTCKMYGSLLASMENPAVGGRAMFEITHATAIDATTTDIHVKHGLGTDLTGRTAPTSFTGFLVTGDGGATSSTATANRLDANTIRLTHATMPDNTLRKFAYLRGRNYDQSNAVRDNSPYLTTLYPVADWKEVEGVTTRLAEPIWHRRVQAAYASPITRTYTFPKMQKGDRLLIVTIHGWIPLIGSPPLSLTVTPEVGNPFTASLVSNRQNGLASVAKFTALVSGISEWVKFDWILGDYPDYGETISLTEIPVRNLASTTPVDVQYATTTAGTSVSTTVTVPANGVLVATAITLDDTGASLSTDGLNVITEDVDNWTGLWGAGGVYSFWRAGCPAGTYALTLNTPSTDSTIIAMVFNSAATPAEFSEHNGGRVQGNVWFVQLGKEFPFIDFVKWGQRSHNVTNTTFGYPTPGNEGNFFHTFPIPTPSERAGNMVLRWKGRGRVSVSDLSVVSGDGPQVAMVTDGRFVMTPQGGGRVNLTIPETDATNPIWDVALVYEDHEAAYLAGQITNPDYVTFIRDAGIGVLRFMDWCPSHNIAAPFEHRATPAQSSWDMYVLPSGEVYNATESATNTYAVTINGYTEEQYKRILIKWPTTPTAGSATPVTLSINSGPARDVLDYYSNKGTQSSADALFKANYVTGLLLDPHLDDWLFDLYRPAGDTSSNPGAYIDGVPIEVQVQLSEECGVHPWINLPFKACTPVDTNVAQRVAKVRELAPHWMVPRFEFGNEIWNFAVAYPGTQFSWRKADLLWSDYYNAAAYYSKVLADAGRVVSQIFGGDTRKYQVIGAAWTTGLNYPHTPAANAGHIQYVNRERWDGTKNVADGYEPGKKWMTHIAITNYWGGSADTFHNSYQTLAEQAYEYHTANNTRKAEIREEFMLGPLVDGVRQQYNDGTTYPLPDTVYQSLALQKRWLYEPWVAEAASYGKTLCAYEGSVSHDPISAPYGWTNDITGIAKGATTTVTVDDIFENDKPQWYVRYEPGWRVQFGNQPQTSTPSVSGMTQIDGMIGTVLSRTGNQYVIDIDSSGFSDYVSGGALIPLDVYGYINTLRVDARVLSQEARNLVAYDFQNFYDAGGEFPSQYTVGNPGAWGLCGDKGIYDSPKTPIYLGLQDFNNPTPSAPNIISLTAIPSSGTAPLTVSFLISATGYPAPTYVVTENGVTVHNSTSASFSRVALAADTYVYNITATNSEGSDTLNSAATVTVSVGGGGGTPIDVKTGDPLLVGGLPILSSGKRIWV